MTWILPLLLIVPLGTAALLSMGLPRSSRSVRGARLLTLAAMAATALIGLFAVTQVGTPDPAAGGVSALAGGIDWAGGLGLRIGYDLDALSAWLVVLLVLLPPVAVMLWSNGASIRAAAAADGAEGEREGQGTGGTAVRFAPNSRRIYAWLLVLQACMLGTAIASDALLFYATFELALLPTLLLMRKHGVGDGRARAMAARTFFFFNFTGSLLTLAAILYVAARHHAAFHAWTFDIASLYEVAPLLSPTEQAWLLVGFLAGFGLKTPLFPLHAWLPITHGATPANGALDVAALVLKLGPYALLRFAIPLCAAGIELLAPVLGALAVIGILYAGVVGWVQRDAKKLLAYSSISHMGFVLLGLFALDADAAGATGAMAYVIAYAATAGGLFACVGIVETRFGTRSLTELQGLAAKMPVFACFVVLFVMAAAGLPGLSGFPGEFLTMLGASDAETGTLGIGYAAAAALGVILAAMYLLWMAGRLLFGPLRVPAARTAHLRDLSVTEITALAPLAALCLVLGFFPNLLLDPVGRTVARLQAVQDTVLVGQPEGPQRRDGGNDATLDPLKFSEGVSEDTRSGSKSLPFISVIHPQSARLASD